MSRICDEVQRNLPAYVGGELSAPRRGLVRLHLRRCTDCSHEGDRQRLISSGLGALSATPEPPPDGLLEALLEQAARPGVKGRAAVPARGAVSGARPGLSVALLVAGAAVGTGAGYAGWSLARAVRARLRQG